MAEPFCMLLRSSRAGGDCLALTQGGRLLEYYEDDNAQESLVGAVMLGTVERVLPDMKAAFVKLGFRQNGFLPIKEQESYHLAQGPASLMTGQEIIVQVKKDEKGDKGVFLTRDIALPGQYALVMPMNRFVGVSKRIDGEAERERARTLGARLADNRFGLIVRHAALFATEKEAAEEIEAIYDNWLTLTAQAACRKAPAMLHKPASMLETLLQDYAARHECVVETDGHSFSSPPANVTVNRLTGIELEALWKGRRVEAQLDEAISRFVPLKGGGSLIIDQREALQTIDVNSGSVVMTKDGGSLPLDRNLAAVLEIARQMRLRNLCGIILIDFIDMATDEERAEVRRAMEEAVKDDRVKTVVHEFTELGLLEMTRRRTRDALTDVLTDGCKACRENGRIRRK